MKNINRYTISGITIKGKIIPIAKSNMHNIDFVTTAFESKEELVNFFRKSYKLYNLDDLKVTYQHNKQEKQENILYKENRFVVDNLELNKKILEYVKNNKRVEALDIPNINNHYLRDLLYYMLSHRIDKERPYETRSQAFKEILDNDYKTKRALALLLNEKANKKWKNYIKEGTSLEFDLDNISNIVDNMKRINSRVKRRR